MVMNFGIDTGYGYTLSKCHSKELVIPSFIRKVSRYDAETIAEEIDKTTEDSVLVEYDNGYYIIGNLAIQYFPDTQRRLLVANRVGDEFHLVMLLTMIGLSVNQSVVDVNVVVGVPNKLNHLKKDMEKWLCNSYEISFLNSEGKIERCINIKNVKCISQPSALIYDMDPEMRNSTVLAIDIGHNTTDLLLWQKGKVVHDVSLRTSIDGVKRCYDELNKLLVARYNKTHKLFDVLEIQLQTAIETGYFSLHGEQVDITDMLDDVLEDFADYLFTSIDRVYSKYLPTVDIIVCGGGIMTNDTFAKKLADKFKSVYELTFIRPKKPQFAIVRGMYNIATELFGDDFTRKEKGKRGDSN